MMTNVPTGDGTFWRTDEALCLNGLIKGRNVDVVGRCRLGGTCAQAGLGQGTVLEVSELRGPPSPAR